MIGQANSPMSKFTGVGTGSGPSMYEIGYNGSPGGAISNALRATIDRYHATLDAQQQQAAKMAEMQAQGQATLGNEKAIFDYKRQNAQPDPDAAGPFTQVDPKTGKAFVRSTTYDAATGQNKVGWSPVSPNAPENIKQEVMNEAMRPILDQMRGTQPNVIQQGAGISTVDHSNSSEGLVQQYMAMYPNKSREEIENQMRAKGMI